MDKQNSGDAEEIVDVVDGFDRAIGIAPRNGIHKTDKLHRSVHIFLINSKGQIWLELRSMKTDTFPGAYNSSAAGHVQHGESCLEAANREILEELGIKGLEPVEMHKFPMSPDMVNEFVTFYIVRSDKIPRVHELTQKLQAYSLDEIDKMRAEGENMDTRFLTLYDWYKKNVL